MPTHKWHLVVSDIARQQIKELPSTKDRMAVFGSIAELLQAENPKAVSGVKKLVSKKFGDQWRQRQGVYRILFTIESGQFTHLKFTYKGKVIINTVVHRSKAY